MTTESAGEEFDRLTQVTPESLEAAREDDRKKQKEIDRRLQLKKDKKDLFG